MRARPEPYSLEPQLALKRMTTALLAEVRLVASPLELTHPGEPLAALVAEL